jgi:glycosyltransferase involved in cell wall biosynthesis
MQVAIVCKHLPHYRVSFFDGLRGALAQKSIDLQLLYGKSSSVPKRDEVDLDWAQPVTNRYFGVGRLSLCWQRLPDWIYNSDLIVLMQHNKILSNHVVLAKAKTKGRKIAFWDHGLNLQAPRHSIGNIIKQSYTTSAFWWFAYTEAVKKRVAQLGFPEERITVVQNAIDTSFLRAQAEHIDDTSLKRLRVALGIGDGPVGLFCGGMYAEKRLLFLIKACESIRNHLPKFEMLFIGAGPDSHLVSDAVRKCKWLHYLGPKFGSDVIPYMKLADVFLMPGLVGLGVLDAFALEKPFITTAYRYHSPEIEYVQNGDNGIITANSLEAFVEGVINVLKSEDLRKRIQLGCRKAAAKYTVESMISNYVGGIETALTTSGT